MGARLQVDGLRCASCVWVTEQVLARTPGVTEATVSYATGRATLVCIDLASRKPRPLPDDAVARLSQWKYRGIGDQESVIRDQTVKF